MFEQRLRLARKRAGMTMQELANAVTPRITAQAISKYEKGKMLPSSAVLVGLGRALNVSLDFLMSSQVGHLDTVEFRANPRASARDRAMVEAILIENLERYLAIEHILDLQPNVDWVELQRCDNVASEADIDAKADQLRTVWNLGIGPIPSLCNLLESKGIKVVEDDLPENVNGIGCNVLQNGKTIAQAVVVSRSISPERKRFTLAYELAHRIIRSTGNPATSLEAAMNRFASAFLIPSQSLLEEAGDRRHRVTYFEVMRLKNLFGVPAACMLKRLGEVGILRKTAVDSAFATFARGWRKSEPESDEPRREFSAMENPTRFQTLVMRAVSEDLISPIRVATLLNLPFGEVERLISGPER